MTVVTFKELSKLNVPPIEYLVDSIIPKSALVYCFGAPGAFKTNFLLYASILGADGQNVFDFNVKKPFKTLWIDEENRDRGMKDKINKIKAGITLSDINSPDNNIFVISENFNILTDGLRLLEWITEYKPDMVVIDSIAKVFLKDERDEKDVKLIYNILRQILEKTHVTIVLIHHSRKLNNFQSKRDMEDISGSREFSAMADSMILIEEVEFGKYMMKQVKNRYSAKCYAINFDVTGDDKKISIMYTGIVSNKYKKKDEEIAEKIMEWISVSGIKEFETNTIQTAMVLLGYKKNSIFNALKLLKKINQLEQNVLGKYKMVSIDEMVQKVVQ